MLLNEAGTCGRPMVQKRRFEGIIKALYGPLGAYDVGAALPFSIKALLHPSPSLDKRCENGPRGHIFNCQFSATCIILEARRAQDGLGFEFRVLGSGFLGSQFWGNTSRNGTWEMECRKWEAVQNFAYPQQSRGLEQKVYNGAVDAL